MACTENLMPKPRLARHLHDFSSSLGRSRNTRSMSGFPTKLPDHRRLIVLGVHLMMHARFSHLLFVSLS